MQGHTTTTVNDTLPITEQVIHTLTVVDGGVGEDVGVLCKLNSYVHTDACP